MVEVENVDGIMTLSEMLEHGLASIYSELPVTSAHEQTQKELLKDWERLSQARHMKGHEELEPTVGIKADGLAQFVFKCANTGTVPLESYVSFSRDDMTARTSWVSGLNTLCQALAMFYRTAQRSFNTMSVRTSKKRGARSKKCLHTA